MENQKEYWAKLFIKKCTILSDSQNQIDDFIDMCNKSYTISENYLERIKKKYTTDDYISRLIPVIVKHFDIEDLKEIIKFYSTEVGKKLLNYKFLEDIGGVGATMNIDIEKDFAAAHNK